MVYIRRVHIIFGMMAIENAKDKLSCVAKEIM
jgi:hypothetical protein